MDEEEEFGLYSKQVQVQEVVRDSRKNGIDELYLIGPIGSSKTFALAVSDISIAYEYPGCIIPVGRKDMSEAQIGTWAEYMFALEKMGFEDGIDYRVREAPNDLRIRFNNGSIIKFIGMNKSRDRQWNKLKITATTATVDEADDVEEDGCSTLASRTGRRNENGAPKVAKFACNPNDAWIKRKIYLPWLKRENRRLDGISDEEWRNIEPLPANKMVIEFHMEDSPLYPKGYYEPFLDRSQAWKQRFLYNNWNYVDDENALFKSRAMSLLTITRLKRGDKWLGVDPNAGGKDRAAIVLWEGDTTVECWLYTTEMLEKLALEEEKNPMNYGAILARLTIDIMKKERIGYENVIGDVVGIGQGWLTSMLGQGYKVNQFRSGDAPWRTPEEEAEGKKPPYFDMRSQMFYMWALAVDNGKAFFYNGMPHLSTLKKELQFHEADSTSKVTRVTPKDDIRKLLGGSPDVADAAMMAFALRIMATTAAADADEEASVGESFDDMYNQSS